MVDMNVTAPHILQKSKLKVTATNPFGEEGVKVLKVVKLEIIFRRKGEAE